MYIRRKIYILETLKFTASKKPHPRKILIVNFFYQLSKFQKKQGGDKNSSDIERKLPVTDVPHVVQVVHLYRVYLLNVNIGAYLYLS